MTPSPRLKRMAMFPSFAVVFRHYRNRYARAENRPQVIARILSALNRNTNAADEEESDLEGTRSSSTSNYSYAEAVHDNDLDKVLQEFEQVVPHDAAGMDVDISMVVAYAAAECMDMKLSRIAIAEILLPRIISREYRLYPVAVWALNAAKYVCEKEALRELSFSDDRLGIDINMEMGLRNIRILPSPFPKAPVSDTFLRNLVTLQRRPTFISFSPSGHPNDTRMSMSLAIANQYVAANARGGAISIELRVSIFMALLALICALARAKISRISTSITGNAKRRGGKVLSFNGGAVHVEVLGTGPVIIVLRKRRFALPTKRRYDTEVVDEVMEGLIEFKNGLKNAKSRHMSSVEYPAVRV